MMETTVVIPAYEPDDRLQGYVQALYGAGFAEIVVVDDGSGPAYGPVFDAVRAVAGCVVLSYGENRGKGAALKTGFRYLLEQARRAGRPAPGAVTADCDGQHTVEDVLAVCRAMEKAPGALTLGCRNFGPGTPQRSAMGNRVVSGAMRLLYGIDLKDTQTGLRGIPGPLLEQVAGLPGQRYEYELNMLIWARQQVIPYQVVPIRTVYFENNAGSHYRTVVDSIPIVMRLLSGVVQYGAAAGLSAVVDVFLYCILVKLAFQNLSLGLRVLAAAAIARAVSSVFNYACNRRLPTAQNRAVAGTLWKYYCLWAVQLAASIGMTWALCALTAMDEMPAKLLVDLLLAVLSYQVQLHWVFAAPAAGAPAPRPGLPAWDGFGHLAKRVVSVVLGHWTYREEERLPDGPRVYVVHHQNLYGPVRAAAFLPQDVHVWALSVFTERQACFQQYYSYTFTQRFGWPRPLAFLASGALSLLVPRLMHGIGAVAVHRGGPEIRETMRQSAALLEQGESLAICPDVAYSDSGAAMGQTYNGFLMLEKYCFARTGQHVAFVPLHCSPSQKALVAGRPVYCVGGDGRPAVDKKARQSAAEALRAEHNRLAARCGDLAPQAAGDAPQNPAAAAG